MAPTSTVRVRPEWAQRVRAEMGDLAAVGERIGVDKSTISRQFSGRVEAGPRFIAAVLVAFPVKFEDAFDVVDAGSAA